MIEEYQKLYYEQYGLHFIHASDEWYISAERDFPEEERYDGYIQLENGVGMMRLLMDEFEEGFQELLAGEDFAELQKKVDRNITLVTGLLPYSTLSGFADRLMEALPKLQLHVYYIRNDFFGETITVTGLVTGIDIVNQMKERRQNGEDIGDTIFVPSNMLRSGEQVFLDDMTVSDIEEQLNVKVIPVEVGGKTLIEAVLQVDYSMDRHNDEDDEFVYIDAYKDY
jgi:NifB/MoaA-like Fe-S oxidoreductase